MCPEQSFMSQRSVRGFLIPAAAIILVGITALALVINRIASQSSQASVLEGLSLQAFYAAESGANFAMNQLFFNVSDRSVADSNCDNFDDSDVASFSAIGLQSCSASVICQRESVAGNTRSFYTVTSTGSCGDGELIAERVIEVTAHF